MQQVQGFLTEQQRDAAVVLSVVTSVGTILNGALALFRFRKTFKVSGGTVVLLTRVHQGELIGLGPALRGLWHAARFLFVAQPVILAALVHSATLWRTWWVLALCAVGLTLVFVGARTAIRVWEAFPEKLWLIKLLATGMLAGMVTSLSALLFRTGHRYAVAVAEEVGLLTLPVLIFLPYAYWRIVWRAFTVQWTDDEFGNPLDLEQ